MALKPIISTNSTVSNYGQINDMVRSLNKEQQVKAFNGIGGKTAVIIGKYSQGKYGLVISDDSGVRRILIGQHPIDGRPGNWVSIDGIDVIDELSV